MRPSLLDLFSGAGGAGEGYFQAGFEVTGVDIYFQPRYPHRFIHANAFEFLLEYGHKFSVIHASPPCQLYSNAQKIRRREHPDFIGRIRELLKATGRPYVIENVPGAPLIDPIELCGAMFGLRTYRHRLFELNVPLSQPEHPEHKWKTTKMGRPPKEDEFMHVVGNFSGVGKAREAMGISWMTRDELREAVPPAYSAHVGEQIMNCLRA